MARPTAIRYNQAVGHLRLHVFVCCNSRPVGSRPSCSERGSRELADALTRAVTRHPDLAGEVRVTPCECLGPCFDGPNLVVYPDGVWYGSVGVADVPELVEEHLVHGRPVERLQLDLSDDD